MIPRRFRSDGPLRWSALLAAAILAALAWALPLASAETGSAPSTSEAGLPKLALTRVTEAGCCAWFSWTPDGKGIRFYDASPGSVSGVWVQDVETGERWIESNEPGYMSPSGRYSVRPATEPDSAVVVDSWTGATWPFDDGGPRLLFSPDETRVAFTVRDKGLDPDYVRKNSVFVSDLRGGDRRLLTRTYGGPVAWLDGGASLLFVGKDNLDDDSQAWLYDVSGGDRKAIVSARFLRRVEVSPDGRFIAYVRALEEDPSLSGLWLQDLQTGRAWLAPIGGSFQWHPSGRGLVVIPPRKDGVGDHRVWWLEIAGGDPVLLTPEDGPSPRIAGLQWQLSPDGRTVAHRNLDDNSIWVLDIGPALDAVFEAPQSRDRPEGDDSLREIPRGG